MDSAAFLELADGTVARVDLEDLVFVAGYDWQLPRARGARRPVARICDDGRCRTVYLDRLITGAGPDDIVLHRNHDPLDNRRDNLVVVTRTRIAVHPPLELRDPLALA